MFFSSACDARKDIRRGLSPVRQRARVFGRDRSGATAVEFSLVALPFLALVCATLELGIAFWNEGILQDSLTEASRQIYTGKFQQSSAGSGLPPTEILSRFRKLICDQPSSKVASFDCSEVRISIKPAANFGKADLAQASGDDNGWNPNYSGYVCGASGSIMVVQAAVPFPAFFARLTPGVATVGNKRILQASNVFKVEPYGGKC